MMFVALSAVFIAASGHTVSSPAGSASAQSQSVGEDLTKCKLQRGDDAKCTPCLTHSQCREAYDSSWFCCPYMKKCVSSSSMSCFYPIADCRPPCHDSSWPLDGCKCNNADFPNNWLTGCTAEERPVATSDPSSRPTVQPTLAPTRKPTKEDIVVPVNPPVDSCEAGFIKGKKFGKAYKIQSCEECVVDCLAVEACVGAHVKSGKKCQLFSKVKKTTTKKKFTYWSA